MTELHIPQSTQCTRGLKYNSLSQLGCYIRSCADPRHNACNIVLLPEGWTSHIQDGTTYIFDTRERVRWKINKLCFTCKDQLGDNSPSDYLKWHETVYGIPRALKRVGGLNDHICGENPDVPLITFYPFYRLEYSWTISPNTGTARIILRTIGGTSAATVSTRTIHLTYRQRKEVSVRLIVALTRAENRLQRRYYPRGLDYTAYWD